MHKDLCICIKLCRYLCIYAKAISAFNPSLTDATNIVLCFCVFECAETHDGIKQKQFLINSIFFLLYSNEKVTNEIKKNKYQKTLHIILSHNSVHKTNLKLCSF